MDVESDMGLMRESQKGATVTTELLSETIRLNGKSKEFYSVLDSISGILEDSMPPHAGSILDYGTGPGVWSLIASRKYEKVYALDLDDNMLKRAEVLFDENGAKNITLVDSRVTKLKSIGPVDAIVLVGVIELSRSDAIAELFQYARDNLRPGGTILCMSRRPIGFFYSLVFASRFKVDGLVKGLERTVASLRSCIEAIFSNRFKIISRARFYHSNREIEHLAKSHGLMLAAAPKDLEHRPHFEEFEQYIVRRRHKIPQLRWHLFKMPDPSS